MRHERRPKRFENSPAWDSISAARSNHVMSVCSTPDKIHNQTHPTRTLVKSSPWTSMRRPFKFVLCSRNLQMKNDYNTCKKGVVSGVALRGIWHENVRPGIHEPLTQGPQRIHVPETPTPRAKTSKQTNLKPPLLLYGLSTTNLHSPEHSKSPQSKKK